MRPLPTLCTLCALALLPLGCIYPAERGKMLEERVDRLDEQRRELETEIKAQKNKLDEQVAQVQEALEKLEKAAHRTGADMGVQLDKVQADLMQLRGQVDTYTHQLTEMQAALDKLKAAPPSTATADKPGKEPETPAKKAEPDKPTDRKGLAALVEKTLVDDPTSGKKLAEEWFKKFPKPDSVAEQKGWSPLAARVHYQLGSALMGLKDWRAALAEFEDIYKSFGKSEEAPEALLKSSECFAALKMSEESRLALEEIINAYPKSEAAKTAKTRLAEMKKAKPAPAPNKKK
jgi:TolA-binding protein